MRGMCPAALYKEEYIMNDNNNNTQQQAAGTRLIDAEDFAWQLSSLSLHDVTEYVATHETSLIVPVSLVLELLDKAE